MLTHEHPHCWHPVAYLSCSLTVRENNYPIQEQELVAMIYAPKNGDTPYLECKSPPKLTFFVSDFLQTYRDLPAEKHVGLNF